MRSKPRRNQRSMAVRSASSSTLTSRRRAAMSAQSRRSCGCLIWRQMSAMPGSSLSPGGPCCCHSGASQSRARPPISSARTAFWMAASKVRSIAITSPVAFIWVPLRIRSPSGNLSKGQRGIFTTHVVQRRLEGRRRYWPVTALGISSRRFAHGDLGRLPARSGYPVALLASAEERRDPAG